jgi:hypothetical protein
MIKKEQVVQLVLDACPSFRETLSNSKDRDLLYVVAGDLARHLLELYRVGKAEEFIAVAKMIEQLHLDGDPYVNELATIGFLEGIQNGWANNGEDPETFFQFLLPESRKRWKALNNFWQGKTREFKDELHNHASDATSESAPDAASSSHQG